MKPAPSPTAATPWRAPHPPALPALPALFGLLVLAPSALAQGAAPPPEVVAPPEATAPQQAVAPQGEGRGDDAVRPLQVNLAAGIEHDSNVLRAAAATSDQAVVLAAGLALDKRYGLQRARLDARATRRQHRDFGELDYSTVDYLAAWDWRVTPRLSGVLSAAQRQWRDILDFAPGATRIDRRTERRSVAEATFAPGGGWRAQLAATHTRLRSDAPRALDASPEVDSLRLGAGYAFASGAMLTAQVRRGDGRYTRGGAPGFKETEPALVLHWPAASGATVDLQAGRLERTHDAEPARDFEGAVAQGSLRWDLTPRTRLETGFWRDLGAYEFDGGGRVRGWRWYVAPQWKPGAKTTLRLRWQRETRDWEVLSATSPDLGRSDRLRVVQLSLEWLPARALALTASLRHEARDSSLAAFGFRARIADLLARWSF